MRRGRGLAIAAAIVLSAGLLLAITSNDRAGAATPTFVQGTYSVITTGTTANATFTKANVAADLIVVYFIWTNTSTATLSDSKGNVYTPASAATTWNSGKWNAQIFYAKNILAGTNTITAKLGTAVNSDSILYIHEYSGLDLLNPLDVTASGTGASAAMTTAAAATTGTNDLLFAGAASTATVTAAGAGFTTRSTGDDNLTEDRVVTSAGSYAATATQNSSGWALQMAAFKAAVSDVTPPTTPTGLAATANSQTSATLTWNASTDAVGVTGYNVYRSTTSGFVPAAANKIATAATPTYVDAAVNIGTYYYAVTAFDAAGNTSAQSNQATLAVADVTAPTVPTNPAAVGTSATAAMVTWTASTDNVAVIGYRVFRNSVQVGTATGTSFSDSGLSPSTAYAYKVAAVDSAGNASAQTAAVSATTLAGPDITPPSAPTNVAATATSSTTVGLTWTASTDNVAVAGYRILRGGVQVGTSTSTSFGDTGLSPSTAYSYTVVAVDAAANASAPSTAALVTTAAPPDITPPSAPTNLTGSAASSTAVNLSWTASTDNVAVTGYRILRGGVQVATSTTTTFQNTGLTPATDYSYTVIAVDAAANASAPSSAAVVTTLPAPDVTPPSAPTNVAASATSTTTVTVTWTASTDNVAVTGYRILRGGVQVGTSTVTTYADSGLSASTTYSYTVIAVDAAANASAPSTAATATTLAGPDTVAPSIPGNLIAGTASIGLMGLSWTPSTDNVGVAGYNIYRGGTLISTTLTPAYQDSGLNAQTAYSYTVTAFDVAGNVSPPSAAATATTAATTPTASLKVNGNSLIDANGNRFVVKGTTAHFVEEYNDVHMQATATADWAIHDQLMTQMESMGVNTLRIALNVNAEGYETGQLRSKAAWLQRFQDIVTAANAHGIRVIFAWWDSLDEQGNWPTQYSAALPAMADVYNAIGPNPMVMYEPWNEPNNITEAQWITTMKATDTYWRTTIGYTGVLFLDTTYWSSAFTPSSADALIAFDAGLLGGPSNLMFANHRYANAFTTFTGADQANFDATVTANMATYPIVGTEYGNYNSSTPQYTWDTQFMTYLATTSVPNGLNGAIAFTWDWVDPNSLVTTTGGTTLSQWGSIFYNNYLKAVPGSLSPGTSDTIAPSTPTGLTAAVTSSSTVGLSWTASTDNVGVAGYNVYRNGSLVGTTATTTYADTLLTPQTAYVYKVAAYDAAGNGSPQSTAANATTLAAAATPAFVQLATATPATAQRTVVVTYASAQAAGDTNVVVVGFYNASATISSVTDTLGNSYTVAAALTRSGETTEAVYYAPILTGAPAGTNKVTVTFSTSVAYADIRALEYSGLAPSNPIDGTSSAVSTGTAVSSGNVVTTNATDLIFGAGNTTGAYTAATDGSTVRVITSPDGGIAADRNVTSTGAYGFAATQAVPADANSVAQVVAFRARPQ